MVVPASSWKDVRSQCRKIGEACADRPHIAEVVGGVVDCQDLAGRHELTINGHVELRGQSHQLIQYGAGGVTREVVVAVVNHVDDGGLTRDRLHDDAQFPVLKLVGRHDIAGSREAHLSVGAVRSKRDRVALLIDVS